MWTDEATISVTGNHFGKVKRQKGSDPNERKFVYEAVEFPSYLII